MTNPSNRTEPARSTRRFGIWTVHDWAEASSTNDLARHLPPWHIARCEFQRNGRGRFNRTWFGAPGGLWASFNLPLEPQGSIPVQWGHLPLVAGLALLDILAGYSIHGARLRWPNDLLVGKSKLAGILVERPASDMAVVGIGINIFNDIAVLKGKVQDPPARLADLLVPCPDIDDIMERLAHALKDEWNVFSTTGLSGLLPRLNKAWGGRTAVSVLTDDATIEGIFEGITDDGSPVLFLSDGSRKTIPAISITRLTEV